MATNQAATALLDADRDGALKFITLQKYDSPQFWDGISNTHRVYRLQDGAVELQLAMQSQPDLELRFGDADGSRPAWLELGIFHYFFWDAERHAYIGSPGGLDQMHQVLGGTRFVADPGQARPERNTPELYRRSLGQYLGLAVGDGTEDAQITPERLAERLRTEELWNYQDRRTRVIQRLAVLKHNPAAAAAVADLLVPLLSQDDQVIPTLAAFALGLVRYPPAAEALWQSAAAPRTFGTTRRAAMWALARLGDATHQADLLTLAESGKDDSTRGAAIMALALLAGDPATVAADKAQPDPCNAYTADAALVWWRAEKIKELGPLRWQRDDPVENHLTWYATEKGLALGDTRTAKVQPLKLLDYDQLAVNAIAFTPDKVWLGTDKGLMAWDRKAQFWSRFAVGGTLLEVPVVALSLTEDGKLRVTVGGAGDAGRAFEYDVKTAKWRELR
jgi:hypothetical protein